MARDFDPDRVMGAGSDPASRAPGESVLAAIERLHGARSNVNLRVIEEGASPVLLRRDDAPAVDDSRYQVLGEIARGGVGVVYRGRDKDLNRDVALKVLRADHADNPDVVQRFIEEAQVGGQLQHPGIVPVYGIGLQPDGRAYFAMKLIKGETLAALLDAPREDVDLLAVFEQVALTMAYAHSRGVIHRDLKPANVMVGAFGEVMVVDWGFAKVLGHDDAEKRPKTTVIATVRSEAEGSQSIAGSVMGTPAYMPPEQALGHIEELDERSDVFALGAILCEILTGEAPYTGESKDQLVAAAQCRLDDAYGRLDACDAPDALRRIARDCLQSLMKDRPKNASVVARRVTAHFAAVEERVRRAELDEIEADAAAAHARRSRQHTLALAALALVALLASGGGYVWWAAGEDARRAAASARVAAALHDAADAEHAGDLAAAVSAARKATELARTEGADDTEPAAVLGKLEQARAAALVAERRAADHDALLAALDEVWALPETESTDKSIRAAYRQAFGPLDGAAERLVGSEHAVRFGVHLDRWKGLEGAPRAKLDRLARRVDPEHNDVRDAIAGRDAEAILEWAGRHGDLSAATVGLIASALPVRERDDFLLQAGYRYADDFHLNLEVGAAHSRRGDYAAAELRLRMAVALRPGNTGAWHRLGIAMEKQERWEAAVSLYRAALARWPDWTHGQEHLARALERTSK